MSTTDQVDNIYWAPVDPEAPNNAHAFALRLIGRNRRVLELGAAAGHFTKAMADNGCHIVAIERDPDAAEQVRTWADAVVVGDLADPDVVTSAIDDERFDVVVAGDVLEHLPNPVDTLRRCRDALKPGGYAVLSVPNVAHADIKLQLLRGRFPYQDTGLLDRTHLHFFTLESIKEMVDDAGLLLIDLHRVTMPVFHTEQRVEKNTVTPELLDAVLADPESETYQFVVRAVVHDGDVETARLASRLIDTETALADVRAERVLLANQLDDARADIVRLQELHEEALGHARGLEELARHHEQHVEALTSTRSYRMLAPFRKLLGRRS